jgi:tripartite-type tricarboxylate transporter receptor subunit TctC
VEALKDPVLARKLRDEGAEPAPMSIAQFREFIKTESAQFGRVVEVAKIKPE